MRKWLWRAGRPGAAEVAAAAWIERREVSNRAAVEVLLAELDPGEAEAIVLAQEIGARWLIVDNREPRVLARRLGLSVVGTAGLLVERRSAADPECRSAIRTPGARVPARPGV